MNLYERFREIEKLAEEQVIGIKGRRKAQKIVERLIENHGLRWSKGTFDNYTSYAIEINRERGGTRSLFVTYNGANKVVKISSL